MKERTPLENMKWLLKQGGQDMETLCNAVELLIKSFETNVVTCVYCGHQYPEGTPTHQTELLTEHIRFCEYHPLRKSEKRVKKLREALEGVVGEDSFDGLMEMSLLIKRLGIPEKERDAVLNAINVLIELIEEELKEGKL
jgi:hypothetical protein